MTSGFTTVLRCTIHFSQNSRQTNPLQVPQKGPYKDGGPPTGHLHISQKPHLSCSPVKEPSPRPPSTEPLERAIPHPQSPFIQLSKSLVDEPSSWFPKSRAPMKGNARLQQYIGYIFHFIVPVLVCFISSRQRISQFVPRSKPTPSPS
jgi:hypothetical protein